MLEVGHFDPRQGLSLCKDKARPAREVAALVLPQEGKLPHIPRKVRSRDTFRVRHHVV